MMHMNESLTSVAVHSTEGKVTYGACRTPVRQASCSRGWIALVRVHHYGFFCALKDCIRMVNFVWEGIRIWGRDERPCNLNRRRIFAGLRTAQAGEREWFTIAIPVK